MTRQPSVDPYKLVLGDGTESDKQNRLSETTPRDQQVWILKNSDGEVVDVERYDASGDDWTSLLGQYVRSISGIEPTNGDVPQVVQVSGPDPSETGAKERQLGLDVDRNDIYAYINGAWRLIASLDTQVSPTRTHHLDPGVEQVSNPSGAPTATDNGDSGSLSAGDYQWKVTFVAAWGETEGSPASGIVTVDADSAVDLTDIPTGPAGTENRNIYRTEADGDTYYLVDTIEDNTTTSFTDDLADSGLGSEIPYENTTEAHSGSLPESSVSFDTSNGHTHDGTDSKVVTIPDHSLDPDLGAHTGNLPWDELSDVPSTFTPETHDLDAKHTGSLDWASVDAPSLASDPHGDAAHSEDYAYAPHDNTSHSETYITSAEERIRFGSGQMGDITKQESLIYPIPLDVDATVVKVIAVAKQAPDADVSSTVTVSHDVEGDFQEVITLQSGNTYQESTANQGTQLYSGSIIDFSLDDNNSTGQNFGVYLIVKTEIGA